MCGTMVVWLRDWPGDQRVAGLIPETKSPGQATNIGIYHLINHSQIFSEQTIPGIPLPTPPYPTVIDV